MYYFLKSIFQKLFVGGPTTPIDPPTATSAPLIVEAAPKEYDLIATTKAEPCLIPTGADYPMRPYLGCTTYIFQEKKTGDFKEVTVPGLEETPLSVILEKVDQQGTAQIMKNGKTYLVGIVEQNKVPVR